MTPADAHKAILQQWVTQWPSLSANTPYAIDNRRITQTAAEFAIVEVTNLTADQVTMGPPGQRRFLRPGVIDVRLYGPRDAGRKRLDELAQIVKEMFEATRLGAVGEDRGITTYATSVREVRNDREYPDLWCIACRTGFEYHERR
jgi:hypothetical protein